jgi:Protein of unknown function (DUF3460)
VAYESDITKFLRDLKKNNPHIEAEQRKGRAIWWDKPQDPDTSARQSESNVPQKAYVYSNKD